MVCHKLYQTAFFLALIFPTAFADLSNLTELHENAAKLIETYETYQTAVNNDEYFTNHDDQATPVDYGIFDFIIVGAGTAGGVVASRLTENNKKSGTFKVLIIEAGIEDPETASVLGLGGYFTRSQYNWGYNTTSQRNACQGWDNNQCPYVRGKTFGGSSSLNGAVYTRGNAEDFDKWGMLINSSDWTYIRVLPYFKKSENAMFKIDIDKCNHGFNGPATIDIYEDTPELTTTLLNAFKETGKNQLDYNGKNQIGTSRVQAFVDGNIRASTSHAYIKPALNRSNFFVSANSLVTKIIIENHTAVGVEFIKNGTVHRAYASKEVIVSGGSINTPQLLMLSGIGPRKELVKHGIEVIRDLPVGQNLYDHIGFLALTFRSNNTYYNYTFQDQLNLWSKGKRPLNAAWGLQTLTFYDLKNDTGNNQPDFEVFALGPPAIGPAWGPSQQYNKKYASTYEKYSQYTDFGLIVLLLHPESKGEVTLQSSNPRDFPLFNPNYFNATKDLETMYQAIQKISKISSTEAFKNAGVQLLDLDVPDCDETFEKNSKDWWLCSLKYMAFAGYHAVGTARMGTSPQNSVINSELKVHGIQGLRVADASVFPTHVSGHTNAAVVMIGEKAADLIKADY